MKKYITVAVILLFIGLVVAPSINANVSKEALVEFTTEVYGIDGRKQTVKLTQSQAEEVEALFDSIRYRLNTSESREEAEEVFKEAVVELDKYGLLGGLSVKQAQKLVIGGYNSPRIIKLYENFNTRFRQNPNYSGNRFCLTAGFVYGKHISVTYRDALLYSLLFEFAALCGLMWYLGIPFMLLFVGIALTIIEIGRINPIGINEIIDFRDENIGIIFTLGTNGIKIWKDNLTGAIPKDVVPIVPTLFEKIGILGFYGLKIQIIGATEEILWSFLLGFSLWVKFEDVD